MKTATLEFPQIRWALSHIRELVATVTVWRGSGTASDLGVATRDSEAAIDSLRMQIAGRVGLGLQYNRGQDVGFVMRMMVSLLRFEQIRHRSGVTTCVLKLLTRLSPETIPQKWGSTRLGERRAGNTICYDARKASARATFEGEPSWKPTASCAGLLPVACQKPSGHTTRICVRACGTRCTIRTTWLSTCCANASVLTTRQPESPTRRARGTTRQSRAFTFT